MSSCLDSIAAGYGLQDKTVQQQNKKQYLGDTYDANGNVTNSPLLELANNLSGKAGTAQGRADMAFGGGGGVPTVSTFSDPAGGAHSQFGWNHGFVTPATGAGGGSGGSGTGGGGTSAPGPIVDNTPRKPVTGNPGEIALGGTPVSRQTSGSAVSGPGTSSNAIGGGLTTHPTGGATTTPTTLPTNIPAGGHLNPDGSITIPTTIPAGTPMPGTPGYSGPGM